MRTLKVLLHAVCFCYFLAWWHNICIPLCQETGAIGKQIKDGIRLMGRGAEEIKWPIHLEVNIVFVPNQFCDLPWYFIPLEWMRSCQEWHACLQSPNWRSYLGRLCSASCYLKITTTSIKPFSPKQVWGRLMGLHIHKDGQNSCWLVKPYTTPPSFFQAWDQLC
jgi:hypothetical protein